MVFNSLSIVVNSLSKAFNSLFKAFNSLFKAFHSFFKAFNSFIHLVIHSSGLSVFSFACKPIKISALKQ